MKIWLLEKRDNLDKDLDPWGNAYHQMLGMVIAAEDEQAARGKAACYADSEETYFEDFEYLRNYIDSIGDPVFNPWLDKDFTTCVELVGSDYKESVLILNGFDGAQWRHDENHSI